MRLKKEKKLKFHPRNSVLKSIFLPKVYVILGLLAVFCFGVISIVIAQDYMEEDDLPSEPSVILKERKLEKEVEISKQATHFCGAKDFRIDISGVETKIAKISVTNGRLVQLGNLEIGNLPLGIDMVFSKNEDYSLDVLATDNDFSLEISNEVGSQKGSFNIPIFFTDTENNQITVCKLNIINF